MAGFLELLKGTMKVSYGGRSLAAPVSSWQLASRQPLFHAALPPQPAPTRAPHSPAPLQHYTPAASQVDARGTEDELPPVEARGAVAGRRHCIPVGSRDLRAGELHHGLPCGAPR